MTNLETENMHAKIADGHTGRSRPMVSHAYRNIACRDVEQAIIEDNAVCTRWCLVVCTIIFSVTLLAGVVINLTVRCETMCAVINKVDDMLESCNKTWIDVSDMHELDKTMQYKVCTSGVMIRYPNASISVKLSTSMLNQIRNLNYEFTKDYINQDDKIFYQTFTKPSYMKQAIRYVGTDKLAHYHHFCVYDDMMFATCDIVTQIISILYPHGFDVIDWPNPKGRASASSIGFNFNQ